MNIDNVTIFTDKYDYVGHSIDIGLGKVIKFVKYTILRNE